MKFSVSFVLVCLSLNVCGQKPNIDSIENQLNTVPSKNKILNLSVLARYYSTRDSAKALRYAKEALEMTIASNASKDHASALMDLGTVYQENFMYSEADSLFNLSAEIYSDLSFAKGLGSVQKAFGNSFMSKGYPEESLPHFHSASEHFSNIGDTSAMLGVFYSLGYAHYKLRNYDSSTHYYFKIIPFCENAPSRTCLDMYNQLGTVYSEINEPVKALKYLKQSLEGSLNNGDSISAANTYMNIAGNYFYQGKMDSCALYVNESINIYNQMGHVQGQVYGLNNLAIIYKETGQINKSFDPTKKAIALAKKINDRGTLSGSYLNLADLHHLKSRNRIAETIADSALSIMKEMKSKYHLRQYYEVMTRIKKAQNNLQAAFDMRELYHTYNDSMVNEQKNKQIAELETKYETEKKEQQIVLLSNEKELQAAIIRQNELQLERNQAFIITLIALIGGIAVIAIFLFKRQQYNQKLKLEAERNAMKADQIKAVINSQEEERKRFAMDLHDDFGQLISALRMNVNEPQSAVNLESSKRANVLLDDMYASLKSIAFNLMPQTLVNKGLTAALDELCTQLDTLGSMKFNLRIFGVSEENIPETHKVAIYRVVQEVVNNVIKYANAEKVEINVTGLEDSLSIMIEDDGAGFDTNSLISGKGNGWRNISSRLELVNGEIDYDSSPGRKYTSVSISIPLVHYERTAA